LDPHRLIWLSGRTCSKIAYLLDTEALETAIVPGVGLVKLRRFASYWMKANGFAAVRPGVFIRPYRGEISEQMEKVFLPLLRQYEERDPILDRYHPWRSDALHPLPDEPFAPVEPMAFVPFGEVRYRPSALTCASETTVRPVYRKHNGEPYAILDAQAQLAGRFRRWRQPTPSEILTAYGIPT
jgi:hypothetical protein